MKIVGKGRNWWNFKENRFKIEEIQRKKIQKWSKLEKPTRKKVYTVDMWYLLRHFKLPNSSGEEKSCKYSEKNEWIKNSQTFSSLLADNTQVGQPHTNYIIA